MSYYTKKQKALKSFLLFCIVGLGKIKNSCYIL